MYTQDYAQKTHNMSHMYNGHTKTARHGAFPHTHTRYTSTEDRRGKRLFWKDEMDLRQPGEQHEQHVHQNQSARTQSLAWCQSSAMILKVQDFVVFFKKNAENIEFERLCPSPIWLILRLASRQILTGSNMRTFFRCCCFFLRLTWHSVTANNHAGAWMEAAVGCFEQDFQTETQRDIAAKMLTGLVCHFKYHPAEVPPTRSSGFYVVPVAV